MTNVEHSSIASPLHGETTELPLTEAQLGLWYAQRLDPANPVFNTGQFVDIEGPLDVSAFERAVARAITDADVLTMRVSERDGEPFLTLDAGRRPRLELVDFTDRPDPRAAALAEMWADMRRPVDPSADPVAVERLYRLSPMRHLWYQRIHHIAIDGYGTSMLVQRVADEYTAAISSTSPVRPFGRWTEVVSAERDYHGSAAADADRLFWHEWFSDRPDVPDMASGPLTSDRRYLTATAPIDAAIDAAVADVCVRSGAVWPDVLVAITAAYLNRHTGGREAIVGVPAMERLGRAAARVPGMVMNVLPMRIAIDEDESLETWIADTARTLQRARKHARHRGEQLRRELGLIGGARRLHGPLINVLPFDRAPVLPGLRLSTHVLATGPVDDLTVTWRADGLGRGLRLEIDGNPLRYRESDLQAHARRLAEFLRAAATSTALSIVPTLTPAEVTRWVDEVNATAHDVPDTTLTALIERTMTERPEAPALKFGASTWSYAELDARSAALADRLVAAGVGRGDVVAVCAERSFELVLSLVSILRAGAAYLPVDPALPGERVETMLASASCRVVLTTSASRSRVPGDRVVLVADVDLDAPAKRSAPWATPDHAPTDPAYVIFTSGSTGVPKGAMIEHRAIVNRLEWMREFYAFAPDDRFLQKTPASFDVSVWEFFLPFTAGALLVVAPPDAHRDPEWLARLVREEGITTLHFVPSMLAVFLNEPKAHGLTLRRVFCSGEELSAGVRDHFHQCVTAELHNLYGPTEAAVDVTYWPATPDDRSNPVPIGFPVWNTQMHVLDDRLRPVPPGVAGDLYIAGVQLGRGYVGRLDLTRDRFIPNPLGASGSRMYKTGDLARRRDDGAIVFLGRSDHQVKIRGFRIELDEIEAVLGSAPGVAQAAVVVREAVDGDKRLVAYVIPRSEAETSVDAWRRWLGARLPDYMVPSAFVLMDEFPLSSNGKLIRGQLPAPDLTSRPASRPPETETEQAVVTIFARALGLDTDADAALPFGVDDDFFALGGHSLLAARVMNAVRDRWQIDAGLGLIFAHSTAARLARRIDELGADSARALGLDDYGIGPLVVLKDSPARSTPLFCIHPAGGLAWAYRTLAHALSPRQVYGLQAQGLDATSTLPSSLNEMARCYADRIVEKQPEGPCALVGWSVGGILAHAVAIELEKRGREVALLAMLDAYPCDRWRDQPPPDESVALTALLQMAGQDSTRFPKDSLTRAGVLAFLRQTGHPLGSLSDQALTGIVRVVQHNSQLVRRHHHDVFRGDLLYFRADVGHDDPALAPEDWEPYVGGQLIKHVVPFAHPELPTPPAVALIAPVIDRHLIAVDRRFGEDLRK